MLEISPTAKILCQTADIGTQIKVLTYANTRLFNFLSLLLDKARTNLEMLTECH